MAPNAAPEDTPMIAGSAMGFRNRAWNTAPAAASAAPTTAASRTRGSRSWNRMTSVEWGTPPGRPARWSFQANSRRDVQGETHTAPTATATRADPPSKATRPGRTRR